MTRIFEDFIRCGYLSLIVAEQNISWAVGFLTTLPSCFPMFYL